MTTLNSRCVCNLTLEPRTLLAIRLVPGDTPDHTTMFSQKKPFSAVTQTVERLTSEEHEEDDLSGIPDLVEIIKLQPTGPSEAARALRKKLKYGSVHRQLRALTLLDGLIQNAGSRFQRTFVDEPLLERLRVCGTSDLTDPDVRKKATVIFRAWATDYKGVKGLERIATLYKEMPRRKQVVTRDKSKVVAETDNPFGEEEEEDDYRRRDDAGPSSSFGGRRPEPPVTGRIESFSHIGSSSKDKEKKKKEKKTSRFGRSSKKFNLEAEKENMKATLADAERATADLLNALQTINREQERISENRLAVQRFEACKVLRRKILRYIHNVESEELLGGLLHANDELVQALMTFEQLDRSIDADSDSEDDMAAQQAHIYRLITEQNAASASSPVSEQMAGLNLRDTPPAQPSRPSKTRAPPPDSDEDDEDDPFADRNAVETPGVEKAQPRW